MSALASIAGTIVFLLILDIFRRRQARFRTRNLDPGSVSYAFFHPDALSGGGGERVLWQAVAAMQAKWPAGRIIIYIRSHTLSGEAVAAKIKSQFNIDIDVSRINFIHLGYAKWIEAKRYPRLTLIAQSLGAVIPGIEALLKYRPDVFVDTVGFAFTYPVVSAIFGCKVVAYVHYPTISSDMLGKVVRGEADFNNSAAISRSVVLTNLKLMYYRAFARMYGFVGSFADVVMVNSTWTRNHIDSIWRVPSRIVYPPCDTTSLLSLPLGDRQDVIVSVAQFRPEKAHRLQLEAFAELLKDCPEYRIGGKRPIRLVLVGGCRNDEDAKLLNGLEETAASFGNDHDIQFKPNADYADLKHLLRISKIGLHTMTGEHFGIGVLEYMAAGAIALAHDSGGPQSDIVVPFDGKPTGFRATSASDFAQKMKMILELPDAEAETIRQTARDHVVADFSAGSFESKFLEYLTASKPEAE